VLEELGRDIWGAVADYHLGLLSIPHRTTVMRSDSGGLLVHSPAKPDDAVRAQLQTLGSVEAIVWPSWWHDLYIRDWASAYPNATIFVAPGLGQGVRSIPHAQVVRQNTLVWPDVEQIHIDRLGVNFDEFVFFHRPSRSLIVADLVVNAGDDVPFTSKILFRLMGAYPGPRIPWCYQLVVRDRKYVRAKLDNVLAWDFDRLIMGHGDVVTTGAKAAFESTCRKLLG